jgi:hypothetical protein
MISTTRPVIRGATAAVFSGDLVIATALIELLTARYTLLLHYLHLFSFFSISVSESLAFSFLFDYFYNMYFSITSYLYALYFYFSLSSSLFFLFSFFLSLNFNQAGVPIKRLTVNPKHTVSVATKAAAHLAANPEARQLVEKL